MHPSYEETLVKPLGRLPCSTFYSFPRTCQLQLLFPPPLTRDRQFAHSISERARGLQIHFGPGEIRRVRVHRDPPRHRQGQDRAELPVRGCQDLHPTLPRIGVRQGTNWR